MRTALVIGVALLAICAACNPARPGRGAFDEAAAAGTNTTYIAPERLPAGRVVRVNPQARFVVLSFPLGKMPAVGTRMFLHRGGAQVAELRICGPQMDDNIVADLLSGDAQPGDSVRGG